MAAPIAHIFLAVQMLAGPFKGLFDEKEFIIGTSFPDIRYLKVTERAETHFEDVNLKDILQEKDSFKAGMLFHSFVDEQREAYVVKNKFYEKISVFRFSSQSLKFAEDEILRQQLNISKYSAYFDDIIDAEKKFNISKEHIKRWHGFLQEYFDEAHAKRGLKELIMQYFDLHEPHAWRIKRWIFSWYYARKISQAIAAITDNDQAKGLILDFYLHFSDNFKTMYNL